MKIGYFLLAGLSLMSPSCESCDSPTSPSSTITEKSKDSSNPISNLKEAIGDFKGVNPPIPLKISGVELMSLGGWLANINSSSNYFYEESVVHPVPNLWTPGRPQEILQIKYQSGQLDLYGSVADMFEFNPALSTDLNYWTSAYLNNSSRSFFLLYNLPENRNTLLQDIETMFRKIIMLHQNKYVTVNGRAVIFLMPQKINNFANLLEEVKTKYPVFFIGSENILALPNNQDLGRIKVLDGIMQYNSGAVGSYIQTVNRYHQNSSQWKKFLKKVESETKKKVIFIPTFQAAYRSNLGSGQNNYFVYPKNQEEIEHHAKLIKEGINNRTYDARVVLSVYGKTTDPGAVIESQCAPENTNNANYFMGCGTQRLEILKNFFTN